MKLETLFSLLFFTVSLSAQEMQPFSIDWRDNPESAVDMSYLLKQPAGRDGFIRVENGHFVTGGGERFRIWGMNFSMNSCFPRKEDAPVVARHLARMGINCVRFHHMDNAGTHFLDGNPENTRTLNPELLDRLDYFISELKKQGIFSNLNLNVARRFKEGDGVREAELLGYAKGATYYDERLIELQKEYAKQLLTHLNPYTGAKYSEEPAVAMVEIVNENSLVESWFSRHLLGQNTTKNPGIWSDIPPSYGQDLTEKYNRWLKESLSADELSTLYKESGMKEGETIPRLMPDQFKSASKLRFQTEARFYMEVEAEYFQEMQRYLKEDLGVKAPIAGSSDHNHFLSGYPHLRALSLFDVVDGHVYWQHPNSIVDESGRRSFAFGNTPMVNDPGFATVAQLARTAVAGKPYTVSEVNHPYPHEYACEGIPLLASYAALQDWDGIFFYTFEHAAPDQWENRMRGHFDFRPDPVKMANVATCAPLFLRGDILPAKRTIFRSYSEEQVLDSLKLSATERPFFTPGFSPMNTLLHATRVASLNGEPTVYDSVDISTPLVSDTDELLWSIEQPKQGVVAINAPKVQALIGYVQNNPKELPHLTAEVENEFCSLLCIALDDRPVAQSKRLLLTATAKAINTGTVWNEKRTSLTDWGREPMLIEPVVGRVTLKGLESASSVTLTPLSGSGEPVGEKVECQRDEKGWNVPLGDAVTVWYLIEIK